MFSSLFSVFSAFLLLLSHFVSAAPVQPVEYIAFAPTITNPTKDTIWMAGSKQNVTWLTSNVPAEAQTYTISVLLGHFANNSENLDIKNPLATQVPIMDGTVTVTVPAGTPFGTNYTVAVLGDSGDVCPPFTIIPSTGSVALH